jgi:hypothetical protein
MSTTVPHRHPIRGLVVVGITLMLAAGAASANAFAPGSVDNRQVRFSVTTFATDSNENVDVVGRLHLVTKLTGSEQAGWTLEWRANLDNTTGTGQITGDRYRGTGADSGTVAYPSGPPVREVLFEPAFMLRPPGGSIHPPSPCRLLVNVVYDESGRVAEVQVHAADTVIGSGDA